jgi:hypothetical protein
MQAHMWPASQRRAPRPRQQVTGVGRCSLLSRRRCRHARLARPALPRPAGPAAGVSTPAAVPAGNGRSTGRCRIPAAPAPQADLPVQHPRRRPRRPRCRRHPAAVDDCAATRAQTATPADPAGSMAASCRRRTRRLCPPRALRRPGFPAHLKPILKPSDPAANVSRPLDVPLADPGTAETHHLAWALWELGCYAESRDLNRDTLGRHSQHPRP